MEPMPSNKPTRSQFQWTLSTVNRDLLLKLIPPIKQSNFVDVGDKFILNAGNEHVNFQVTCSSKLERAAFLTSLTQRSKPNASSRNS